MKKSRTTMNVPARTTGSGAQRRARSRARRDEGEAMTCVLMAATIPPGVGRVDYLRRRRRAPRRLPRPRVEPGEREVGDEVRDCDEDGADDRDRHEHREVAVGDGAAHPAE